MMQTIQIILQRTIWAGCFCFALTAYHIPSRALPIKLGEATELNSGNQRVYLAQRLGTEVGGMIEFQSAYVLTRVSNQGCWGTQCTQTQIKKPMLQPSPPNLNSRFNQSLIELAQSESIR